MKKLAPSEIDQAALLLKQGIVVAFPTETVYGLGARVFDVDGASKIYQMKGRPSDNPLICHICSLNQLPLLAREIPPEALKLAHRFWPGPLTLVLKKQPTVPASVTGGLETVAIRMPHHALALELIQKAGEPLVAPSANLSGKPSSTTAEHVLNDFQEMDGAVIDGGPTKIGLESTVLYLAGEKPLLLRPGAIKKKELEEALGYAIELAQGAEKKASPGLHYRHYAPHAKVTLVRGFEEIPPSLGKQFLMSSAPKEGFHLMTPASLYALLRQADQEQCDEIIAVCLDHVWNDLAFRDRLLRAAGAC